MKMNSINKTAKLAETRDFFVILTGISNEIMVRNFLFVSEDNSTTVKHILAHRFFSVLVLYKLLKPVNNDIALIRVAFALVKVFIGMVNLHFKFAAPLLLSSSDYSTLFTTNQRLAQVLVNMNQPGNLRHNLNQQSKGLYRYNIT